MRNHNARARHEKDVWQESSGDKHYQKPMTNLKNPILPDARDSFHPFPNHQ